MPEDGVMFHFGTDIGQAEAQIEQSLHAVVASVEEAARKVAGITVPGNFGDQIVRGTSTAAAQVRANLASALDPRNLDFDGSQKGVSEAIRRATVGAVEHAELELDRALKQLSPAAQLALRETGLISQLMAQVTRAIAEDARRAYTEMRGGLSRELRRQLPSPGKLPILSSPDKLFRYEVDEKGQLVSRAGKLADTKPVVAEAHAARVSRLFPENEDGDFDYENPKPEEMLRQRAAALKERQRSERERQKELDRIETEAVKAEAQAQLEGVRQVRAGRLMDTDVQARGNQVIRAQRMMEADEAAEQAQIQRDGNQVIRAKRLMDADEAAEQAEIQRAGNRVIQAHRLMEGDERAAQAEVQRQGATQAWAERLDKERTQRQERDAQKAGDIHRRALDEEGRRNVTEALRQTIGNRDPYAEGLGYRIDPATGLPTHKVGGLYTPMTNVNDQEEALRKIDDLRNAHSRTLALQNDPSFQQLNSRFAAIGDDPSTARYFQAQKQGAHELWVEITNTVSATRALSDAQNVYNKQLDAAAKTAARQAAQVKGFIPGVVHGAFGSGFNGSGPLDKDAILGNLGKTVGSAARYSLAYGGFYQFVNAAGDALDIFKDFQDSFTDYQVAVGDSGSVTSTMTNQLMELSRVLGENVGAAYDAAARGVRAFASDATDAEKALAGLATASAAQKVSVIANKSLTDATGDVVSIGEAFGMNAQQTEQLLPDWLANAKRTIGGDPSQIAQGLSNFAVTAGESGFSGQEAANMIALIQSRTDESGQAVATRLTRIIQIATGSTGKSLARDVNRALGEKVIDTAGAPKEIIEQFSRAYVKAGDEGLTQLQGQIRSQLGGTSNLKELIPLLEANGQKTLADALKKAVSGAGQDEYQRKIENLIGTLNKLKSSIQNIVVLAAESDIFAPFAVAVKVLEPTLHMLENILKVYEKLEGGLGPVLGPVGTMGVEAGLGVAAYRKLKQTALAGEVASSTGFLGAVTRSAGVPAAGSVVAADTARASAATTAAGADARAAASANALAGAELRAAEATNIFATAVARSAALSTSGGLTSGIPPWLKYAGLAIAGGLAVDSAQRAQTKFLEYNQKDAGLLGGIDPKKAGPKALRDTADALESLGNSANKDISWMQDFNNFLQPSQWRGTIKERTDKEAELFRAMAAAGQKEKERADALKSQSVFGDSAGRTTDSITEAFKSLDEAGVGAHGQLKRYFNALMTPPDEKLGSYEMPSTTSNQVIAAIGKGSSAYLDTVGSSASGSVVGKWLDDTTGQHVPAGWLWKDKQGAVAKELNLGEELPAVRTKIMEGIRKAGPNLNQAGLDKIAEEAIAGINTDKVAGKYAEFNSDDFRAQLLTSVKKNVKVLYHQAEALRPLSPAELQGLLQAQQNALQNVDPSDPTATARQTRENYLQLQARVNATGTARNASKRAMDIFNKKLTGNEDGTYLDELFTGQMRRNAGNKARRLFGAEKSALKQLRHAMREAAVQEAEDHRAAVEAALGDGASDGAKQATRLKAARISFRRAGADVKLLEGLMESMDRQTVKAILEFRKAAVQTARIAMIKQQELVDQAERMLADGLGAVGGAPQGAAADFRSRGAGTHLEALKRQAGESKKNFEARKRGYAAAQEAYDRAAISESSIGDKGGKDLTAWQKAALRQQAQTDPDRTVQAARDNLNVARANLDAIKDHQSSEYFSALQSVTQAQDGLAKAVATASTAAAEAGAAKLGGALAPARVQILQAKAQMAATARGTVGWFQALGQFYQGQQAMRDAVIQYKNNLGLLRGDSTDPVEQARDAQRAAIRKLRADRGMGKDVRAEDRVAAQEARNSLLGAKFDQRFNDMQTADELGRISHQKYLAYLDHEHDRLTAIKHRTRQQQDQLDQVDKAMKSAKDAMDGQFNLGDINTNGLVYQVRRFKEEARSQAAAAQLSNNTQINQQVTVSINGADTAKIRSVLDTYLNISGGQRKTLTRRKV